MLVITDPTPSGIAAEVSPRAYAWTEKCEDLSGLEVIEQDWIDLQSPPPTLHQMLSEIGRVYVPFLIANADAVASDADMVECDIAGRAWRQQPFVYQAKCLRTLQEEFSALPLSSRKTVAQALNGTGCEPLIGPR